MTNRTRIVVIGGGYAGVMAANRLTQRDDLSVTLINPRPTFVERMRLHQLVAGSSDARVNYGEILSANVHLTVNSVTRIDASARCMSLGSGDMVDYDYLVYAVGSGSDIPDVTGGTGIAHPIATLEDATRLKTVIDAVPATEPVTVVGAGPTGIETAAELAENGRRVTLVCGHLLGPDLHPRGRSAVARQLAKLDITLIEGYGTKVTKISHEAVKLDNGREIPTAVTIWTAGFSVPDLASRSGLTTDRTGRLITDETLTSLDDDRIVAAGDAVSPSGLPYRMSAYAATRLGAHAADTVISRVSGVEPAAISLGFFGVCISIGRRMATLQVARKDDTANGVTFSGGLVARLVKEGGTRGVIKHLAHEAHKPGSHTLKRKDHSRPARLRARCGNGTLAVQTLPRTHPLP